MSSRAYFPGDGCPPVCGCRAVSPNASLLYPPCRGLSLPSVLQGWPQTSWELVGDAESRACPGPTEPVLPAHSIRRRLDERQGVGCPALIPALMTLMGMLSDGARAAEHLHNLTFWPCGLPCWFPL